MPLAPDRGDGRLPQCGRRPSPSWFVFAEKILPRQSVFNAEPSKVSAVAVDQSGMEIGTLSSPYGLLTLHNSSRLLRPRQTGDAFAADIVRRAGGNDPLSPVPPVNAVTGGVSGVPGMEGAQAAPGAGDAGRNEQEARAAEHGARSAGLEKALSGSVNYMADHFGDKAAAVMMGLVYKRVGDGPVTEESLGNALLDVAKFVDKNFGIEAGDGFINHLNGDLNDSLNAYFENGSSEEFLAVTISADGASVNGTDMGDSLIGAMTDSINAVLARYAELRKKPAKAASPYGDLTDPLTAKGILLDAAA